MRKRVIGMNVMQVFRHSWLVHKIMSDQYLKFVQLNINRALCCGYHIFSNRFLTVEVQKYGKFGVFLCVT